MSADGLFLEQREPGPAAIRAGIDNLLAGERARHGGTWSVVSLPIALGSEGEDSPDPRPADLPVGGTNRANPEEA